MEAQIQSLEDRRAYLLGGRCKVTLVSKRSGARFTYSISRKKSADKPIFFVSVLIGPNNQDDYRFIGTIFGDSGDFRHSLKSPIGADALSVKAFAWSWQHLGDPDLEVWHSGACSRCGRELTDPESIARGLGPVCAQRAF